MAPGHANNKVVIVEIVEEYENEQRVVKRLVGDDADRFAEDVKSAGIIAKWKEMF